MKKATTMRQEDLFQLASSGLPSLGGSYENPSWNRSLQELMIAGDSSRTQSTKSVGAYPPNSLLTTRRLSELERIQSTVGTSLVHEKPSIETDFLRWEDAYKRIEIKLLKSFVRKAEEATRNKSLELYEKLEQEDWETKRELWTKELVGTRNLGGSLTDKYFGASLESSSGSPPIKLPSPVATNNATNRFVDSRIVMSHLEIVKRQKDMRNFVEAANDLAKVADSLSPFSLGGSCYATAMRLVSRILSRQHFSPVEIALATLDIFSGQFDAWMIGKIRKADLEGQNQAHALTSGFYKSPNANTVAIFVSMELRATAESALWPSLYYCLRIGDAVAAREVFECAPAADESDASRAAIFSILSSLAQRQGSAGSFWAASGQLVLPSRECSTVAEVFEMSKTAQDLYRTGVLSLLSGAGEIPTTNTAGFGTIEDYIFGLLWRALQSTSPDVEIENVGKVMLKFGASYFDDQDSGGWSYSLPLLASQQFCTALSYLAQAGGTMGLLQATHLGLLLESSGAKLDNLGESDQQFSGSLLTSLLVDYSNWLQGRPSVGAIPSLHYLQLIPNKSQMMAQVSTLILQTQDLDSLAGYCADDGKRVEGALGIYFSQSDVSLLLKQAAEKCLKGAKDRERRTRAAQLFMRAGDFRSLVVMLSVLVSPDPDVQNEENLYWYEQSKEFLAAFVAQRTDVVDALERNGAMESLSTLKATIDVYEFFTLAAVGKVRDALSVIGHLDILPQSWSDIGEKTVRHRGLDPLLKQRVPGIMVATMKSFYREHARLKLDLQSGDKSSTLRAMKDLKEKATVLLAFAGLIAITQSQMEDLNQIEASMI